MKAAKGYWGIDIGQSALKALRLELVDGQPTATAFDYVEHAKILSQPDADPDTLIREALEKFLSRNTVKGDEVAIGIAGQSGLARFVKLPPVQENKVAEIVKFEAKQQIPFPLDEVEWDFQKIGGGESIDGFALETEIGLFAMKKDIISRYLGYFASSKIEVHLIQMSPLALVNFATYELLKPKDAADDDTTTRGKKHCTVVMDVGTDASNLIITDGAKIIWQRPIPLGGNNFTRALTKEMKLTFAKAEHLKRNAAKSPDMASILRAIKPILTDFVGEVQRSLGYFTNTHRDAHVAHMVGLGSAFKLPGLQKYLSDKLSLEVKKPSKFEKLAGETVLTDPLFKENLLTFAVAYGLALQGLGQARLTTNLLPQVIRIDRIIRSKKPYAAAAAAALLLGLGGMSAGFSNPYKAINDESIKKSIDLSEAAVKAHAGQESKFTEKLKLLDERQANTKTIIAGQEERLNWPRFTEVFTASLPRPGVGGNLTETAGKMNNDKQNIDQVKLWKGEGTAGEEAIKWFYTRMSSGVPPHLALDDARSVMPASLARANIETVHTRYVTDIAKFLKAADDQVLNKYSVNIADWMRDEERENDEMTKRWKPKFAGTEGGWVVEIRGFTDHNLQRGFVEKALVRNLQRTDDFIQDENKVKQYIVGVKDPVKGNISHAFMYLVIPVTDPQPNQFVHINTSYLDGLLGGGTQAGGPGDRQFGPPMPPPGLPMQTGGMPMTPEAPLSPPWTGLGDTGNATAGSTSGPTAVPPAPPPGLPPKAGEAVKKEEDKRKRTEFVVMMIWREPLPTSQGAATPGTTPTPTQVPK